MTGRKMQKRVRTTEDVGEKIILILLRNIAAAGQNVLQVIYYWIILVNIGYWGGEAKPVKSSKSMGSFAPRSSPADGSSENRVDLA